VATEVIYSTRYNAEDVRKHLGTFLRHYPDLIVTVDQMWQGSSKDYVVLAQIFVQLKKEVATIRMSQAKQYRWGQATARDKTDDMLDGRLGATVTAKANGVQDVVAQVLMLKRSLKRRAQGNAPRLSLT